MDERAAFPESVRAALPDLVDTLDVGVVFVDSGLVIRGWNRWMETASGMTPGDVMGRPLVNVFPDIRPAMLDAFRTALAGKPVVLSHSLHRFVVPLPPPPGHEDFATMQQTVRLAPVAGEMGADTGAVAFIQDVTERVARERDLRLATENAEAANRSKSDFLATMSHELRTPIGAMTGYTDLILTGIYGPVTDDQQKYLGRIKTVGKHLLQIVEAILLFARVEAGREEINLAEVDAFQLARDALSVVEPMAIAKGIELVISIPAAPLVLRTDPVKVRQILINLLGNAIKFTAAGKVGLTASGDVPDMVTYAITDTGPGIAAVDIERIFEPFTQVSGAYSRTQTGTGLGLPVSRRLATMLGGGVTVTSEAGKGSTFVASIACRTPDAVPR